MLAGGAIHAYDRHSGALKGTVQTLSGRAIKNDGLWGLQFGNGAMRKDEVAALLSKLQKEKIVSLAVETP